MKRKILDLIAKSGKNIKDIFLRKTGPGWTGILSKLNMPAKITEGSAKFAQRSKSFLNKMDRMRTIGRITGATGGSIAGGAAGLAFGAGALGSLGLAAGGGLVGGGGIYAASKIAKFAGLGIMKYPKTTASIGITGISGYSFIKPIISSKLNRPTNPALPSTAVGPGYVTFGNSPRIRMPHNNLGATGDLTLSAYKLRHGKR